MTPRHLGRVRLFYGLAAPLYDALRHGWSRLTPSIERELDRSIADRVDAGSRILELAPGTGVNLARLGRLGVGFGRYLGIDASQAMLSRARRVAGEDPRIELRHGDVRSLDAGLGRFDVVLSTWLLAHIEDPPSLVRAALALLEPGGSAIFVFSSPPRNPVFRFLVRAIYRMGAARLVDPGSLAALPDLETQHTGAAGLATLLVFRTPAEAAREHR